MEGRGHTWFKINTNTTLSVNTDRRVEEVEFLVYLSSGKKSAKILSSHGGETRTQLLFIFTE